MSAWSLLLKEYTRDLIFEHGVSEVGAVTVSECWDDWYFNYCGEWPKDDQAILGQEDVDYVMSLLDTANIVMEVRWPDDLS
jgi:hypothetical protein